MRLGPAGLGRCSRDTAESDRAGAQGVVGVLGRCSRDTAADRRRPTAFTCKTFCSSLRRLCSVRSHNSLVLQMWELQNLAGRRLVLQKMWELQQTGLDGVQTAQEALDGLTRVCVCVCDHSCKMVRFVQHRSHLGVVEGNP